jgi:hypothetical protein
MGQKELYYLSTKLIDDPVVDHDPVVGQLVVDAEDEDVDSADGVVGQHIVVVVIVVVVVERVGQLVLVDHLDVVEL